MTMFKYLGGILLAVLLSTSIPANAAVVIHTTAGGLDAAGEATGTLTVGSGVTVTAFSWGTYSAANRWELQRQVGAPGSGVFRKVLRLDSGAATVANAFVSQSYVAGPNGDAFRIVMTTAGTGDVQVSLTDAPTVAKDYGFTNNLTKIIQFDDFSSATAAIDAAFYVSQTEAGDGTDEAFLILVTEPEGALFGEAGGGGDGTDATCVSTIDLSANAGLVSDGPMWFETRLRTPDTTASVSMSLINLVCAGTPVPPVDIDSGTVTFATGTFQDGVGMDQHGDATNLISFVPWAANADAEQFDGGDDNTTGDEMAAGTLEADIYITLRVEVDATGDCYFYVNGALKMAGDTCVATSALLTPRVHIDSTVDGAGATDVLYLDYWYFGFTRPSTP